MLTTMTDEQKSMIESFKRDLPLILSGDDPHNYPAQYCEIHDPKIAHTLQSILEKVAYYYQYTIPEMASKEPGRDRQLRIARQLYFYLARKHTAHSYTKIGEALNRDATTAKSGEDRIKRLAGEWFGTTSISAIEKLMGV